MDICILLGILSFCQIIFKKDTCSFIPQLRVLKNKQQNLNCHGFICSLNKYKWGDSVPNVNKQVIWKLLILFYGFRRVYASQGFVLNN